MYECEIRVCFQGGKRGIEWVHVFATDDDGQWFLLDTWEAPPFHTFNDVWMDVRRAIEATVRASKVSASLS